MIITDKVIQKIYLQNYQLHKAFIKSITNF